MKQCCWQRLRASNREITDEFAVWEQQKEGDAILGYGQRDITLRRKKIMPIIFLCTAWLWLHLDCYIHSRALKGILTKGFSERNAVAIGESLNEINKTAVLLWAAWDKQEHSWELSACCQGDWDMEQASKEGQSIPDLHLVCICIYSYSCTDILPFPSG